MTGRGGGGADCTGYGVIADGWGIMWAGLTLDDMKRDGIRRYTRAQNFETSLKAKD